MRKVNRYFKGIDKKKILKIFYGKKKIIDDFLYFSWKLYQKFSKMNY